MIRDQLAAETEYTIPEESGECLITPPAERVPDLLAASKEAVWGNAEILGVPLAEFRRRVRARALALAAASGSGPPSQGDPVSERPPIERPLILMGHQPLLFHPGVWAKYFLLTRLCVEHDAVGLHLIVDTDATGPVTAEVPDARERLQRVSETLIDLPDDVPLEAAPPPEPEAWGAFVHRIKGHLATLPSVDLVDRVSAYAAGEGDARRTSRTLAEFLARLRRSYEARAASPGYLELPVSQLADTPEFRAFALHLLRTSDEFLRIHNASLEAYRRTHHLRSVANPFPNLTQAGGRIETPFWVVRGGRRTELFVAQQGARRVLATATDPLITIPADADGVEGLAASGVALRPRAMTLTLFARLCLGDLFVHGVSGGRYDRVTDVISAQVFGCRPPAYMVATATLFPSLFTEAQVAEERRTLERRLMDLRHNPDRYLESSSEDQRRLVDEKWALIRAVETMRPGPDRRAATRRIREVNVALAGALTPEIARLEARLADLQAARDVEDVVRYRGYPFFMFDPAEVGALVGAVSRPA